MLVGTGVNVQITPTVAVYGYTAAHEDLWKGSGQDARATVARDREGDIAFLRLMYFTNHRTEAIMKNTTWISMLALPLALASCQPEKIVKEKMDAGADKVAEGMKEMTDAAGIEAAKAGDKMKEAVKDASATLSDEAAKAKAAAAEATAKLKIQAAEAAAKAKENVKQAVEDTKESAEPKPE